MDFLKNSDKIKIGTELKKNKLIFNNKDKIEEIKNKNLKGNSNNHCKIVTELHRNKNFSQEKKLELIKESLNSLYKDRTKPHLQELFRRIKEKNNLNNYTMQMLISDLNDNKDEFIICNNNEVYFKNYKVDNDHWIDPKNPEDPYSAEIWNEFLQYINELVSIKGDITFRNKYNNNNFRLIDSNNNEKINDNFLINYNKTNKSSLMRYQFKGGRYGVALEIYKAKIGHLENLSLGELSHLVQLAINKGILQYENNVLKPRCTCMKIAAAVLSLDIDSVKNYENLIDNKYRVNLKSNKDLKILKYEINEILRMYPKGILLSLLKRFFNIFWGKKLSPTVYGYTRISALLLSEDFKDICRLYFDNLNHVLVQSTEYNLPENVRLLQEDESNQKDLIDLNLFLPLRSMNDISFEYMRLLNM